MQHVYKLDLMKINKFGGEPDLSRSIIYELSDEQAMIKTAKEFKEENPEIIETRIWRLVSVSN